eukprot:scaffold32557_cov99-Isochrysis_galbana.AAC.4
MAVHCATSDASSAMVSSAGPVERSRYDTPPAAGIPVAEGDLDGGRGEGGSLASAPPPLDIL